jgi:hypothetical protein
MSLRNNMNSPDVPTGTNKVNDTMEPSRAEAIEDVENNELLVSSTVTGIVKSTINVDNDEYHDKSTTTPILSEGDETALDLSIATPTIEESSFTSLQDDTPSKKRKSPTIDEIVNRRHCSSASLLPKRGRHSRKKSNFDIFVDFDARPSMATIHQAPPPPAFALQPRPQRALRISSNNIDRTPPKRAEDQPYRFNRNDPLWENRENW